MFSARHGSLHVGENLGSNKNSRKITEAAFAVWGGMKMPSDDLRQRQIEPGSARNGDMATSKSRNGVF